MLTPKRRGTSHSHLMHRIALEIVAVIAFPRVGLLASKLGGKTSTNLAAPQNVVKKHLSRPDGIIWHIHMSRPHYFE